MNVVVEKVLMFNPFALLGVEQSFTLDKTELENKYLELMKTYHPDKVTGVDDASQKLAFMTKSTQINDAYNLLKDDVKRGQALIDLQKDHAHFNENVVKNDFEFIVLQINLREQAQNLSQNFVEAEFNQLQEQAKQLTLENKEALKQAFHDNNLELAQKLVYRLQFLAKLSQEIETLEMNNLF